MIKIIFQCSLLFTVTLSCTISRNDRNLLSSRVVVIPAPYGVGDKIRPGQPFIYTSTGNYPCRPRPINPSKVVLILEDLDFEVDGFSSLFGLSEKQISSIKAATPSFDVKNLQPIRTSVTGGSSGWLKLGLFINNGNRADNAFYLVVTSVVFHATAKYRDQIFQNSGDIQAGYCNGTISASNREGEGAGEAANVDLGIPYLYLVPPRTKAEYSPFSDNPFHNLTLYLQGFDIIDNTDRLAPDQQRRVDAVNNQGRQVGSQSSQDSSGSTDSYRPGDPFIVIPRYTVDLILRGFFITKDGLIIADFTKKTRFFTQSSVL